MKLQIELAFEGGEEGQGPIQYSVEMGVFSGRDDPRWVVGTRSPWFGRLSIMLAKSRSTRMAERLGYRGFTVEVRNVFGQRVYRTVGAGTNPELELVLLNSSPTPLEGAVRRHVTDFLRRRVIRPLPVVLDPFDALNEDGALPYCRLPDFNPLLWSRYPQVTRNNCYNYATNRMTDTFAQPGRATGRRFSRPLTARGVLAATIRDGFIPLPHMYMYRSTCVFALAIWPGVDYHFYRMDSNLMWSHKPGRTPVRNTDNSGSLIKDPRLADRGNYVVFAAYLANHSNARVL
ncbi:uncharacterized protein LOC128208439 [Mya arenaria]|uniref:uncharacterized protein LOC128208439 n=1 Tax=Mya arenaria TaxID=6604 RepID=UPI0022E0C217|nr:uncharacterized protein LOC128208439 [Mya arenaria]